MYLCDHKQDKFIDMKIMTIDGGPRKTMNTAAMIEKFSEGVKSVDKAIEVKHVRLYDIDYKGCYSCLACKVRGKASHECKIKDGLLPVIQEVNQSDGLVLASPVFFGRWTGQVQTFIERFTYPWLSYEDFSITPQRKMPLALILTMNGMPSDAEAVHNKMNTEENFLLAKLGDMDRIDVCNTLQVKNYDRYEMDAMNPEGRKKYNAEHWEEELQQAFDAGKRMAEKIKANAE